MTIWFHFQDSQLLSIERRLLKTMEMISAKKKINLVSQHELSRRSFPA
jgi:hypothetical protein